MKGWVEYSSKKYLPDIVTLFGRIRVISARSEYEDLFPSNVEQWKFHAFLEAKACSAPDILTNIIAVSDSERDGVAAHNLAAYIPNVISHVGLFRMRY